MILLRPTPLPTPLPTKLYSVVEGKFQYLQIIQIESNVGLSGCKRLSATPESPPFNPILLTFLVSFRLFKARELSSRMFIGEPFEGHKTHVYRIDTIP